MISVHFFSAFEGRSDRPNLQFWAFQTLGWLGYSLVTFFTLTVWDDNVSWSHVEYIMLQAALGMLCCWPLQPLFRWAHGLSLSRRLTVCGVAVLLLSWLWTASRLVAFAVLSGQHNLWNEFNDWYFGSLFVFLSWTAIYYGINYYRLFELEHKKLVQESARQHEEYLRRVQAESATRDAQLQMLRYQLNPHFLFNTLNALNALVTLGFAEKAQNMIEQLSKFLRHSLDTEAKSLVPLKDELFAVRLYLDIEQARFEDRLKVNYSIDPAAMRVLVPSLILQPLIENSMKYAIARSEAGGVIQISAVLVGQRLQLDIRDSGPGMSTGQWVEGRGIGLSNTLDRLDLIYAGDFVFEATSVEPRGLNIRIDISINPSLSHDQVVKVA
jgi:two-component system LytT family sensor kinase